MVDVTSVRQYRCAGKAREGFPLGSQKHDVASWHLRKVGEATGNALNKEETESEHHSRIKQPRSCKAFVQLIFGKSLSPLVEI